LQGFSLKLLKHLVLDEADRLLNMDFEQEIDQILKAIPKVACCLELDDIHLRSICIASRRASQLCGFLWISSTCLPSPTSTKAIRLKQFVATFLLFIDLFMSVNVHIAYVHGLQHRHITPRQQTGRRGKDRKS